MPRLATATKSFENVSVQIFQITVTNQHCIREEMKNRLHSGMLETILFRIFSPPVFYPKTWSFKLFGISAELGLSYGEKNKD
jgi:hypothetical protein